MERTSLRGLFSACDVNKSGRIEYADFAVVCRDLNVPETEIRPLFRRFDPSEEGYIDYRKFSSRFKEVSGAVDLGSLGGTQPEKCPWEKLMGRADSASLLPESLQEQLCGLHRALHTCGDLQLLQQFEDTVLSLITHTMDCRLEAEQLHNMLKRAEQVRISQLVEQEDYIQHQLFRTEVRVREEQNESKMHHCKEEVVKLNRQISTLSLENEQLRALLIQAQTNTSLLQSDLDTLKSICADQRAQHHRELNQQLYDSNAGLCSALAGEVMAAQRRNEILPLGVRPFDHSSSRLVDDSKQTLSDTSSWAKTYLDSGLSLTMDTAGSPASDCDSDDSGASYKFNVKVSELRPEGGQLLALSPSSSMRSSIRRRLSAFSTKPSEADIAECKESSLMYRLVLAGDAGSGKSSFLLRLTFNEFRGDIQTTLGVDFQMKKMLVDGEKTSLQIWDTAGQERFRSIARSYFRKAHGILLLYDVTSESSFLNIRAWIEQIQDTAKEKIPMCVIGNKVDLRGALPEDSCVSALHGEKLAKAYGALFCETSAKEGTNVVEAVLHLAREVKKSVQVRRQSGSQVKLNQITPKKFVSSCCVLV